VVLSQSKVIVVQFTSNPSLSLSPWFGGWNEDGFRLTLIGEYDAIYRIEYTSDLQIWKTLANLTNKYGISQATDSTATNRAMRFYRALQEH
jgi:hypothetical protein